MVFSNDLKKWIYLDPTNNAYIMDEKGTLLSIEEVRQKMIENKPLILNPDANWNNLEVTDPTFYLTYYFTSNSSTSKTSVLKGLIGPWFISP
jgi:hypothetical protein